MAAQKKNKDRTPVYTNYDKPINYDSRIWASENYINKGIPHQPLPYPDNFIEKGWTIVQKKLLDNGQ